MRQYQYCGYIAYWYDYKHCWTVKINGVIHHCLDTKEVEKAVDEALGM